VCEREKLEFRTSVDAVQDVIHLDVVSPNPAAIMTRPQQEYNEYPLAPGYQGCLASLLRTTFCSIHQIAQSFILLWKTAFVPVIGCGIVVL
jgi:hypothetical protein